MKKPLPLLIGSILCTNALLNGVSANLASSLHQNGFQKLFGVSVAHAEEAAAVKYTCPMHHQVISDTPGKCPICGMDLVPIPGGHGHTPTMQQSLPGTPVVEITADNIQKMGVRTEKVTKGTYNQSISANGIVMANERSRVDMFSQVEGRIEDLKYSAVGDKVKKGDLFFTLYSPELLTLQNDYIAAKQSGIGDLANAAKKRMKLLGVDDKIIAALSKTGHAYDKVPFYIPADGVIGKLEIRNGHYLKAGDEIGHVQDLSSVWVEVAVPEKDIATIKEGDTATVLLNDRQNYNAKVDYIYPTINAESRTGRVRLVVDNKDGMLRPASYATVAFGNTETSEKITVPTEAVLHSSDGTHVIIALGNGKFQSRKVQTGANTGGRAEIVSGLKEGEDVAVSSQFLIDSESSLQESLNKLSGGKNAQ